MTKTLLTAGVFLASASTAFASTVVLPTAVPELSAIGATAAIATVAGVVALVRERRNRRD